MTSPSRRAALSALSLLPWIASACGAGDGAPPRAGGDITVDDRSSYAYSMPAPGLDPDQAALHATGDAAFEAKFVSAPSPINPGLGPLYNNLACASCHVRDGRGRPVAGDAPLLSQLLVRVSLPDGTPDMPGGPVPVPGLGLQIEDHATAGSDPEAVVSVQWVEVPGTYGDGSAYSLRRPEVTVMRPDGSSLPAGTLTSYRQPPPVFGLGLLASVPDAALEEMADPDDADGDGISGRVNRVWDPVAGAVAIGRFGHKANVPGLDAQAAGAYANDMGVGNRLAADPGGVGDDITDDTLDAVIFYTRTLAVPARASLDDPAVQRGEALFSDFGCGSCHTTTLETGPSDLAVLDHQTFHPYTDLLLHDLGDDLADGRPDFEASGNEWRTAPLWGIGVAQTVLYTARFLHDGRARTLAEAILWHGGEAESAREAFRTATSEDRGDLVRFLSSL